MFLKAFFLKVVKSRDCLVKIDLNTFLQKEAEKMELDEQKLSEYEKQIRDLSKL